MEEYVDKDLKGAVKKLVLKQGVSKEGNGYYYLELSFNNGYSKRIFLNSESQFAITNAIDVMETTRQLDKDF